MPRIATRSPMKLYMTCFANDGVRAHMSTVHPPEDFSTSLYAQPEGCSTGRSDMHSYAGTAATFKSKVRPPLMTGVHASERAGVR